MTTPTTSSTSSQSKSLITDPSGIAFYNRGPLITIFTPRASCLSTLTSITTYSNLFFGHVGTNYFDAACFPPSTTPTPGTSDTWALYYYSPGQCPLGWSQATTLISSFPGASTIALSIGAETTVVVCCPSGYDYPTKSGSGLGHQCESTFSMTKTLFYVLAFLNQGSYTHDSVTTTIITATPYIIYGDGIPIWWQSSDIAKFKAASLQTSSLASSTNTTTATDTLPPTATSTSSLSSLPSAGSSGLSDGAKAAIGVSVPLSIIAILISIFFCFRYRQQRLRQRRQGVQYPLPELSSVGAVPELYSN